MAFAHFYVSCQHHKNSGWKDPKDIPNSFSSSKSHTRTQVSFCELPPVTNFRCAPCTATLAISYGVLTLLISAAGCMLSKKYTLFPAATLSTPPPTPLPSPAVLSSSQVPTAPSTANSPIVDRVRRSHHRILLSSAAVIRMLRSGPHTMDLIVPPWTPGPIS